MSRSSSISFASLLRRFRRGERAAAAVEFALIVPFLLLLYMGSMEASSLYTVNRRIIVIAGTVADLVARWNPSVTPVMPTSKLKDYFKSSEGIITPYHTTGLSQVVTSVNVTAAGVATVLWSCGYNGGTARAVGTAYPLPATKEMNVIARGGTIIAAEISYPYRPVLGIVFPDALTLTSESLFLPRFVAPVAKPASNCPT